MKLLILLTFLSLSANAYDALKISYGVGFEPENILDTRHKSINLGYYFNVDQPLVTNVQLGYLGDRNLNSMYVCTQFGASLKPFEWAYVENFFGPCALTKTAEKLSGVLQFQTTLGAGWRDPKTKVEAGLKFVHFSNAGLRSPNIGRDLLMLSLAWPL